MMFRKRKRVSLDVDNEKTNKEIMTFKMKGFPMHSSVSALKQTNIPGTSKTVEELTGKTKEPITGGTLSGMKTSRKSKGPTVDPTIKEAGGPQMKSPLMQWVYDSSEEIISPVTGKPYPEWIMKKSPEGKYSARARAIEAHNEDQFASGGDYFDWKQENDYVSPEPPPLAENIQWDEFEGPAEKGLTSEEYEKTPESEL